MRATLLLPVALLLACDAPPVDPDNAPPPTGVIQGTIIYAGPRPRCVEGRPVGQVVLTLFEHDNPPPPSGNARSALNLFSLPGDALFNRGDCLPADPTPGDIERVAVRSTPFVWPDIPLGLAYQIRGFYDYDADFVPFFSVTNLPTKGDLLGAAFVDSTNPGRGYARIAFDPPTKRPQGQVVSGVLVSLGAPANTERPLFVRGGESGPLSAEATIPVHPDAATQEEMVWQLTKTQLDLVGSDDTAHATALGEAGIDFDFSPSGHAWYVRLVDADGDGKGDLHPILGSQGVAWSTPILILRRARTLPERAVGVPDVLHIGSVRPSRTFFTKVFAKSIEMLVVPVAVVDLDPTNPVCRVAYVAPGNIAPFYEALPADCQDLPSGPHDVNVLHGLAGGAPREEPSPLASQTGFEIDGGAFSGQAWTIPNELGPPDAVYDPFPAAEIDTPVAAQGPDGRLLVHDPDPTNDPRRGCGEAFDPFTGGVRTVNFIPVPPDCCAPVAHLCGLPLCEAVEDAEGRSFRRLTALAADGTPPCVPFEMPLACCGS